jgi:hypothetical protein
MTNIIAYADDIALLAPSLAAIQELIAVLVANTIDIDVVGNTDKIVCMVDLGAKARERLSEREFL